MRKFFTAMAAALLIACGGKSPVEPTPPLMSGKWTFADSMYYVDSIGSVVCFDTDVVFTLAQKDSVITGTSTGGMESCRDSQGNVGAFLWPSTQFAGLLRADSLYFAIQYGGVDVFHAQGAMDRVARRAGGAVSAAGGWTGTFTLVN